MNGVKLNEKEIISYFELEKASVFKMYLQSVYKVKINGEVFRDVYSIRKSANNNYILLSTENEGVFRERKVLLPNYICTMVIGTMFWD